MQNLRLLPNDGPRFTNTQEHIAYLERENTRLQNLLDKANETIIQLQALYDKVVAQLKRLKSFISWENKLFATPHEEMPDAQKIIARTLPTLIKNSKDRASTDDVRDDGLTRVYRADIAKATGKSDDRVGAGLKAMGVRGSIKHKVETIRDKKTKQVKDRLILVDVTEQLMQANIKSSTPGNTGNNQKNFVCKECHSTNTVARKVIEVTCKECGTITILDPSKKEDRAFIVDDNTAEHFDEWYGEVDTTEIDDMLADTMPRVEAITEPIPMIKDWRQPVSVEMQTQLDAWKEKYLQ